MHSFPRPSYADDRCFQALQIVDKSDRNVFSASKPLFPCVARHDGKKSATNLLYILIPIC